MRAVRMALAAVLLGACAKGGGRAGDSSAAGASAADTANAAAAVAKVREAWADGAHNKDAAGVAAMYTDDAVLVGSEQPLTSGRSAIQAALEKQFPISHGLQINSENTDVSGDLAYDFGTYAQEVQPPGGKMTVVGGAYLVVLKRQANGSWKIVRHMTATPPKG
jgi:uncharacterized protein (TIGR02246 family)